MKRSGNLAYVFNNSSTVNSLIITYERAWFNGHGLAGIEFEVQRVVVLDVMLILAVLMFLLFLYFCILKILWFWQVFNHI